MIAKLSIYVGKVSLKPSKSKLFKIKLRLDQFKIVITQLYYGDVQICKYTQNIIQLHKKAKQYG